MVLLFTLCLGVNNMALGLNSTDDKFEMIVNDIDGQWSATIQGPDGEMDLMFTFKVEGTKLTGSVGSIMGDMPLTKGKVDGNKFSFEVDAGGMVIKNNGVFADGKIVIKADIMGEMVETILTKV